MGSYYVGGPCKISIGGGDDITTKAGVIIRTNTQWAPVTDDAHGEHPADYILVGKSVVVEAATNDVANLRESGTSIGIASWGSICDEAGNAIGAIVGTSGNGVSVTIKSGKLTWNLPNCVIMDPAPIVIASTQEVIYPLVIQGYPDVDGKLITFTISQ